ncbi:MAG: histidine--tRNA ligase [Candidatus Aminicenantes bacterium]|nr:histidine--tRNA ligase [Candidatus Aminicenantes bacterium]
MAKQEFRSYRGMRDFLPEEMRKRDYVFSILEEVFKAHGFEKLETPAIELWEILSGKYGEEEKLIYRFKDRKGREVGLRYDLTVPLARVVVQHRGEITFPFKRYQMERVWRADRPQKGRYREFYQCDVDIVGSSSIIADAEVITIIYESLKKLGFDNFVVRINNRKLISALHSMIGEGDEFEIARAMDKLDKKGIEGVKEELFKRGISKKGTEKVIEAMKIESLEEAKEFYGNHPGIKELMELFEFLVSYGIEEKYFEYDPSLARGLDYYTGPIFETVVKEPKIGSITGGGRYDRLIGMFSGEEIPATGTSLGVERIIAVMEELSMFPDSIEPPAHVLICHFPETKKGAVKLSSEFRKEGLRVDLYSGEKGLRAQLGYASDKGIPFVVIVGEEINEGKIVLKNLDKREQEVLPVSEAILKLKNLYTSAHR